MDSKPDLKYAIQSLYERIDFMNDAEKRLKESKVMVSKALDDIGRILLETRPTENPFNPELIYGWVNGLNHTEIDGVVYSFIYDNDRINDFKPLEIIKIEEKEVNND